MNEVLTILFVNISALLIFHVAAERFSGSHCSSQRKRLQRSYYSKTSTGN